MREELISFLVEWFRGPNTLGGLMLREVGYCSDMEGGKFARRPLSPEGLVNAITDHHLLSKNLFFGLGFWLFSDGGMEPRAEYMLYDRLSFDFDAADSTSALVAAVIFAEQVSHSFNITPIVFQSGFKGARVVIPLSPPTTWRGFQLLWDYFYSSIPSTARNMVDTSMKQWNRLDRVPFTWNIRRGERRLAELVFPFLRPADFDWRKLRPLDPRTVTVYTVPQPKVLRFRRVTKGSRSVTAPCMLKLLNDARSGVELSHFARLSLACYMLCKGFSIEEVIDVFRKQPDFKERVTRYHVEYVARRGLKPYNCNKMRELGLCADNCPVKNPLVL